MPEHTKKKKILAISTAGGHWVELMCLLPALDEHSVVFVTTNPTYRAEVEPHQFYALNPATRWNKLGLILQAVKVIRILLREKPDVIITTGAACGFFALLFGKFLGARTIWVDSVANAEIMSLSGRLAGRYADLWLTQWPDLAKPDGPYYKGSIL